MDASGNRQGTNTSTAHGARVCCLLAHRARAAALAQVVVELTNQQVAHMWLHSPNTDHRIKAAVYFDDANCLRALDRSGTIMEFRLSPYAHQLDACVVFLDEAHTRGTDIKFPPGTRAAVTLGRGLTKDKLVQACMRMRQLQSGGHTVAYYASNEAHVGITAAAAAGGSGGGAGVGALAVLEWAFANSIEAVRNAMLQWAVHGLHHAVKTHAQRTFGGAVTAAANDTPTAEECHSLASACQEEDRLSLMEMYTCTSRRPQPLPALIRQRADQTLLNLQPGAGAAAATHTAAHDMSAVCAWTDQYAVGMACFAAALEDEEERELEQELEEEEQLQRPPPPARAHRPSIHPHVAALACGVVTPGSGALLPIWRAFDRTRVQALAQPQGWDGRLLVTHEFCTVVQAVAGGMLDDFARPPAWIMRVEGGRSSGRSKAPVLVLVSPFEANHLLALLRAAGGGGGGGGGGGSSGSAAAALVMFAPRLREQQHALHESLMLRVPPLLPLPPRVRERRMMVQVSAFAGVLYFGTAEEQQMYCDWLGLCPAPRTAALEAAFLNGRILRSGFMPAQHRAALLLDARCAFTECPCAMVKAVVDMRGHCPLWSHFDSLLSRGVRVQLE
eukprot:TRINITY_DN64_c7_g1_i3.p1 TRINITY_DN64_c7_g1~~TRINITY_DN64_c7_g1_i3.p1  ORF type:complete len:616 (+),score=254.15 TRINITY_DN64_c7_g1_i3:624-2471(+)